MKLGTVMLQVGHAGSLDESRRWYEDHLGLKVRIEEPGESVFYETGGGTTLALHVGPVLDHPERITLYFEVDDIDGLHQRLNRDGVAFREIRRDRHWGGRVAETADPVGHLVHLMSWSSPKSAA